jgi:hypothetical protein
VNGYLLKGSRDEYLMVIRTSQYEMLVSIVDRLAKMREKEIKEIVKELQFSIERINNEQS